MGLIEMRPKRIIKEDGEYQFIYFILMDKNVPLIEYLKNALSDESNESPRGMVTHILTHLSHDEEVNNKLETLLDGIKLFRCSASLEGDTDIEVMIAFKTDIITDEIIEQFKSLLSINNDINFIEDSMADKMDKNEPMSPDNSIKEIMDSVKRGIHNSGIRNININQEYVEGKKSEMGNEKMMNIKMKLNEKTISEKEYYILEGSVTSKGLANRITNEFHDDNDLDNRLSNVLRFVLTNGYNDEYTYSVINILDSIDFKIVECAVTIEDTMNFKIEYINNEFSIGFARNLYCELNKCNDVVLDDSDLIMFDDLYNKFVSSISTDIDPMKDEIIKVPHPTDEDIKENRKLFNDLMEELDGVGPYDRNKESEINVNGGIDNMFEIISDAAKQVINMSISNLGMEIECELDNLVAENNDIRDIVQNGNDTRKIETTTKVTIEKLIIKVKTTISK